MFASFLCLCLLGFAVAFPSEPPFQRPEGWGKPICPEDIDQVGRHYSNWTVTHDISSLFACYEPKLVLFPIGIPIDSPESNIYIRNAVSKLSATPDLEAPASPPKDSWMNHTAVVSVGQGASQGGELDLSGQVVTAARHLSRYLLANDPGEGKAFTLFLHFGKSVVGVYLGGRVHTPLTAVSILDSFASYVSAKSPQGSVVFQHCGAEVAGGLVFGVVSSISGGADGLVAVQKAVQAWARGECHGEVSETETFNLPIWAYEPFRLQGSRFGNMTANSTVNATFNSPIKRTNNPPGPVPVHSDKRAAAACSEIRVESDNGCEQLADRCGISIGSLYQYNNGLKGTCTRLKIGQRICCTSGGLKSNRKSPGTDGVCASHLVKPTENCDGIASMYDVEAEDLVRFNKGKTWQWAGCGAQLRFDTIICVSEGEPPMPPRSSGAKCGPQADKDTPRPPKGTSLASLNPCPLNACCSQWGHCDTAESHCASKAKSGEVNLGTTGCISNCGISIVNNDVPPKQFIKIAYFEGWNTERPCLWNDVKTMDLSGYTHIHFAFAKLTPSFTVDVSFMQQQFDRFKTMKSHKRVISFGGWVDSTATDKFWIFREAVKPGNRDRVINNLVSFVTQNGLDRLDIDWEYPAAPDIPDIPSADPLEGQAYLEFLKILRSRLPSAVSLSIATPAGFWYLQGFPVVEVSKVVDYIVYMTYDFHGQWDYGRKHSIVGCQSGDCLRSHINMTETMSALVLITKAGVPSHKIIVGVSSYGRSFKMLYPGCTGDKCPFTGPKSGAKPGVCTGEPGYLANAEINRIIADKSRNPSTWYDAKTMTNYLVYDDIQWVAYMDDANKADRTRRYRGLNFGGTTDWAVDLQRFGDSEMRYLTDDALAATEANDGTCPWRNTDGFHCDQVNAVDTAMDGGRRWKMAACDCAWVEFMKTWELRKSSTSQTFSNSMAEFFKLGEGLWECEDVSDGCYNMQAYCQDTQTSNQTGPAAPLIAKSFASVQRILHDMWEALDDANGELQWKLDEFINKFIYFPPDKSKQQQFNLFIDMLGIFFSVFSAPFFNHALKGHEKTKDISYNIASWGGSFVKDAAEFQTIDRTGTIFALKDNLLQLFIGWKAMVSTMNGKLFSGEGEGLDYLHELIRDGKMVTEDEGSQSSPTQRGEWAANTLMSMMIPIAWYTSNYHPFVIDTGRGCDERGYLNDKMMSDDTEQKTWACHGRYLYYLVAPAHEWEDGYQAPKDCTSGGGGPNWGCATPGREARNWFRPPPSIEELRNKDDRKKWGNVWIDDMVAGSMASYLTNGRRNGVDQSTIINTKDFMVMISEGSGPFNIHAPGIFRFPACGPDEAMEGWKQAPGHMSPSKAINAKKRIWPCRGWESETDG